MIFLCLAPLISGFLGGQRDLRISGVYQSVGAAVFVLVLAAAWAVGLNKLFRGNSESQYLAATGGLLIVPTLLISLLWVGLATPWDATPSENLMRYEVLSVSSVAMTVGFVLLWRYLSDAGERFYSAIAFSLSILGGAAYLIWNAFQVGNHLVLLNKGQVSPSLAEMNIVLDVQLFAASVLTYLAAAFFSVSMSRAKLLGKKIALVSIMLTVIALIFLSMRGLVFPNPNAGSQPWYLTPGFIVGIPAVPWLIPIYFGIGLLKRAARIEALLPTDE